MDLITDFYFDKTINLPVRFGYYHYHLPENNMKFEYMYEIWDSTMSKIVSKQTKRFTEPKEVREAWGNSLLATHISDGKKTVKQLFTLSLHHSVMKRHNLTEQDKIVING